MAESMAQEDIRKVWMSFRKEKVPRMPDKSEELQKVWCVATGVSDVMSGYVGSMLNTEHFPDKERAERKKEFEESVEDLGIAMELLGEIKASSAGEKKEHDAVKDFLEAAIETADKIRKLG